MSTPLPELTDSPLQHATLHRKLGLTPSDGQFIVTRQDHPLVQAFLTFYAAYCAQPSHLTVAFLTITLADIRRLMRNVSLRPAPPPTTQP